MNNWWICQVADYQHADWSTCRVVISVIMYKVGDSRFRKKL